MPETLVNHSSFGKAVVPFDLWEPSSAAILVAQKFVSDVHVLYVVPELPAGDPYVISDEFTDEKRIRHARDKISEQLDEWDSIDSSDLKIHVVVGKPGPQIAKFAAAIDADLIVIPSHGRTGLERVILGSVAEHVVRHAKCSVLVLKRQ
jgi:nucleotide-binding universal stress UspA family protein